MKPVGHLGLTAVTFLILPLLEQVIVVFLELCVTLELAAACVTTGEGVGVGVGVAASVMADLRVGCRAEVHAGLAACGFTQK